ncbi:MAG: hypothetical protein IKJ86_06035 [Clostridia bacterium]|nr:hypothetical protein [Clostridia bacterium]
MKRVLSTILAIVMVFSVCSSLTFTASATVTEQEAKVNYEVKTNGLKNGELAFDVYLVPNQTINTAILSVKFDSNVFDVVTSKTGPATAVNSDGDEYEVVAGTYEHGMPASDKGCYTFAYMTSNDYKIGSTAKKFVTITLKLKSGKAGTRTNINFYKGNCEDCVAENLFKSYNKFLALETPVVKSYWLEDGAIGFNWNAVDGAKGGYFVYKKSGDEFTTLAAGTTATSYKDSKNLVNGTTYTYAIASRDGVYGEASMKYEFSITYVAPPTVTISNASNGVNVKWTKVSSADKYIIYRSTKVNDAFSSWETLGNVNSTKLTYIDATAKKGVTYRYAVSAVIDDVATGYKASAELQFIPLITSLAAPTVKIAKSAKGITATWNEIENAESYIVYRRTYNTSTKKYSGWTVLKSGYTGTSYTDTTVKIGTTYNYAVKAVNGSVKSKYIATNNLKYDIIPTVKIANASNGVKVSWTTVANATGYRVYSSTYNTKTKKWSGWTNRGTTAENRTTWTDTKAKSGTYYKYTVRAMNGSVGSSYKASAQTLFLAQPTVKIANNASGVKVTWNKIAGSKGYTVYRSEYVNGAWTSWKNMGTIKNGSTVSWVDKSVKSGTQYRYTVRAINGNYKSTYKASTGLLYLAQPKTTVKAVSNGVNVAWTQSTGAQGYTIYRMEYNAKTKKWSGWKKMGTAAASKTNWTDKSAKKGVYYKYTVKAVSGSYGSAYKASGNVKR